MNYAQFKQMENQATTSRVYSAMRTEEKYDYYSDDLLWGICKGYVEHGGNEDFEDFIEYFLWETE